MGRSSSRGWIFAGGDLYVPDAPGLGVEVDMDYLRAHVLFGGE